MIFQKNFSAEKIIKNTELKFYNEPWPYSILDNTYDVDGLEKAVAEIKKKVLNAFKGDRLSINLNHSIEYRERLPFTYYLVDSFDLNSITDSFGLKSGYRTTCELSICKNGWVQKVHDETGPKMLSCVTYIDPIDECGTMLYDSNKDYVGDVEWKVNRSMIFAKKPNVTWHSFRSSSNSYRITINQFLH